MNATVFRAVFDHYVDTDALLATRIDYVAKHLLMAFETHERPSLILPRQALSFNSLEAVVKEDDDHDADFRPCLYNSILFHLMTAWQECKNARYVAEYPIMDPEVYPEIPYFITELGYDTLDNFQQELKTRADRTPKNVR